MCTGITSVTTEVDNIEKKRGILVREHQTIVYRAQGGRHLQFYLGRP